MAAKPMLVSQSTATEKKALPSSVKITGFLFLRAPFAMLCKYYVILWKRVKAL